MKKIIILLLLILFQGFFISSSFAMTWQDYNNLGNKNHSLKNYTEAIENYNNAIKLNPYDSSLYTNRGTTKLVVNDYAGAIADFEYAINLNKYDNTAKTYLKIAEEKVGIYNYPNSSIKQNNVTYAPINSVKSTSTSIPKLSLKPMQQFSWQDYKKQGNILYKNEQYSKAILLFSEAIRLNPNDAEIYFNRGVANYCLKDYYSALNDFNKAKSLNSNNSNIYGNLSLTKYALNDYDGAIKDIDTAISIEQNNASFYYLRGQIYEAMRLYGNAEINYKQSLNISPNEQVSKSLLNLQNIKQEKQIINTVNQKNKESHWYDKILDTISTIGVGIVILLCISFLAEYLDSGWGSANKKINPLYEESVSSKVREFFNPEEAEERKRQYQKEQFWKKYWDDMSKNGWGFENAVGKLYKKLGYKVTVTQGSGDGGVDLILKKDNIVTIVQCKAHMRQVGPEPVRALWGVRDDFNATKAIFVAYSGVTVGAQEFARGKNMEIVDANDLVKLSIQAHSEK